MEVSVHWDDQPDEENFHLWRIKGTYTQKTRPDLFVCRGGGSAPPWDHRYDSLFQANLEGRAPPGKSCCDECFVDENIDKVILTDDRFSDGHYQVWNVVDIPDNGYRFDDYYHVEVQQLSLTKDAYRFFTELQQQLSISGEIFDPPPGTIRSNFINTTDPSDRVIGYFGVFYASHKTAILDPEIVPDHINIKPINVYDD